MTGRFIRCSTLLASSCARQTGEPTEPTQPILLEPKTDLDAVTSNRKSHSTYDKQAGGGLGTDILL